MTEKDIWKWLIPKLSNQTIFEIYDDQKIVCPGFRLSGVNDIKTKRKLFESNLLKPKGLTELSKWAKSKNENLLPSVSLKGKEVNELIEIAMDKGIPNILVKLLKENMEKEAIELFANLHDNSNELLNIKNYSLGCDDNNVVNTQEPSVDTNKKKTSKTEDKETETEKKTSPEERKIKKLENKIEKMEQDYEKKEFGFKSKLDEAEKTVKQLKSQLTEEEKSYRALSEERDKLLGELKRTQKDFERYEKKAKQEVEEAKQRWEEEKLHFLLREEELVKEKKELEELASLYGAEVQELKEMKETAKTEEVENKLEEKQEEKVEDEVEVEVENNAETVNEVAVGKELKEILVIGKPIQTKSFNEPSVNFIFVEAESVSEFNFSSNADEYWVLEYELSFRDKHLLNENSSYLELDKGKVFSYANFVEVKEALKNITKEQVGTN